MLSLRAAPGCVAGGPQTPISPVSGQPAGPISPNKSALRDPCRSSQQEFPPAAAKKRFQVNKETGGEIGRGVGHAEASPRGGDRTCRHGGPRHRRCRKHSRGTGPARPPFRFRIWPCGCALPVPDGSPIPSRWSGGCGPHGWGWPAVRWRRRASVCRGRPSHLRRRRLSARRRRSHPGDRRSSLAGRQGGLRWRCGYGAGWPGQRPGKFSGTSARWSATPWKGGYYVIRADGQVAFSGR